MFTVAQANLKNKWKKLKKNPKNFKIFFSPIIKIMSYGGDLIVIETPPISKTYFKRFINLQKLFGMWVSITNSNTLSASEYVFFITKNMYKILIFLAKKWRFEIHLHHISRALRNWKSSTFYFFHEICSPRRPSKVYEHPMRKKNEQKINFVYTSMDRETYSKISGTQGICLVIPQKPKENS